jgi:hypothetical protein
MLRIVLPLLLLAAAGQALAADNETSRFLGPESDWGLARLELKDVHGGVGGTDVAVAGSGSACVRLVDASMVERRFFLTLDKDEALALVKLAVEQDVLGVKLKARAGAPGELRAEVVLENALGVRRSLLRWQKDEVPALEKVEAALRDVARKCEGKEPVYSGKLSPFFQPLPAVHVTVLLYSGRPDPSFDLVRPEDWDKLHSLLEGLARTTRPDDKAPRLGYRGFALMPRDVAGLPRALSVFKGTIRIGDNPTDPVFEKDEKALEDWLKEAAKKRGIDAEASR